MAPQHRLSGDRCERLQFGSEIVGWEWGRGAGKEGLTSTRICNCNRRRKADTIQVLWRFLYKEQAEMFQFPSQAKAVQDCPKKCHVQRFCGKQAVLSLACPCRGLTSLEDRGHSSPSGVWSANASTEGNTPRAAGMRSHPFGGRGAASPAQGGLRFGSESSLHLSYNAQACC